MKGKLAFLVLLLAMTFALAACSRASTPSSPQPRAGAFTIVSGSENQDLESIVKDWGTQNGVQVSMIYKGSLEISNLLATGAQDYDAIWPANSLWINLGDTNHLTKDSQSIKRSPVVLAIKKSIAQNLGWVGNNNVRVADLLAALKAGKLRLLMTNASQSNSGASSYFAFLYAFASQPDVLTSADLQKPEVRDQVHQLLTLVNRTAESSGFLEQLFVQKYDQFDAMMNYEALAITANTQLVSQGQEPLYVVYLSDGLAIADSPLAYVDHGDANKEKQFQSLQQYLLSANVQKQIQDKGWRTAVVGTNTAGASDTVFNPAWGIDVNRTLSPIKFPNSQVIQEALNLYQGVLRKPSQTVFVIDFSGSMGSNGGEQGVKQAMQLILDQQQASQYLLQATPDDITEVILFNNGIIADWTVKGNNPDQLKQLANQISQVKAGGGTDIYSPAIQALDSFTNVGERNPAIILMTDGQSNTGKSFDDFQNAYRDFTQRTKLFVPIYAIAFGDADMNQLNEITAATDGSVYNGKSDLVTAFKKAKGNN